MHWAFKNHCPPKGNCSRSIIPPRRRLVEFLDLQLPVDARRISLGLPLSCSEDKAAETLHAQLNSQNTPKEESRNTEKEIGLVELIPFQFDEISTSVVFMIKINLLVRFFEGNCLLLNEKRETNKARKKCKPS